MRPVNGIALIEQWAEDTSLGDVYFQKTRVEEMEQESWGRAEKEESMRRSQEKKEFQEQNGQFLNPLSVVKANLEQLLPLEIQLTLTEVRDADPHAVEKSMYNF